MHLLLALSPEAYVGSRFARRGGGGGLKGGEKGTIHDQEKKRSQIWPENWLLCQVHHPFFKNMWGRSGNGCLLPCLLLLCFTQYANASDPINAITVYLCSPALGHASSCSILSCLTLYVRLVYYLELLTHWSASKLPNRRRCCSG